MTTFDEALTNIFNFLIVCFFIALLGIGFFIYSMFSEKSTFKTKSKPVITWELKAKGQTIDTVWIYTFKK